MTMMALTPFVSAQQQCFDESGTPVGDAGAINVRRQDSFVGLSFERTSNGAQCPCSYVSLLILCWGELQRGEQEETDYVYNNSITVKIV